MLAARPSTLREPQGRPEHRRRATSSGRAMCRSVTRRRLALARRTLKTTLTAVAVAISVWAAGRVGAQHAPAAPNGEWRSYAGDLRNHHYSPLDQISADNFAALEVAWHFKT